MAKLSKIDAATFAAAWARVDIPLDRMAAALGCSRQALSFRAKRDGLPSRVKNREPQKLLSDEVFRRMWTAGVSSFEMAKAGGYSHPSAIGCRRILLGLPKRTRDGGSWGGWHPPITLDEFREMELGRLMAAAVPASARARPPAPT